MAAKGLIHGPLGDTCLHLCVDMQRLFAPGGPTDVRVLATVLGAVDRGFRVILVTDAVCGSADETHDALMEVYHSRFSEQIEAVTMQEILESWR